ncbi:MAG: methyltransferase domain-containing protein [Parcubacteria group bacterium]|nr:methyltransferase domain-containing protein [Parcubacteria group bacterium]
MKRFLKKINFSKLSYRLPIILFSSATAKNIAEALTSIYNNAGAKSDAARALAKQTILEVKKILPLTHKENQIRKKIDFLRETIIKNLGGRTDAIYENIKQWIMGDRILDLGSGAGDVGEKIKTKMDKNVVLADTNNFNKASLPFLLYDGNKLPFGDGSFDTVLLITVLHHASNYTNVLGEARRVASRIIVIETIYGGETASELNENLNRTIFLDWFYNRVLLNYDIDIPCNFATEQEWRARFNNFGLVMVYSRKIEFGALVPFLSHQLFVLNSGGAQM